MLQRAIGNAAVAALIAKRRRVLQRQQHKPPEPVKLDDTGNFTFLADPSGRGGVIRFNEQPWVTVAARAPGAKIKIEKRRADVSTSLEVVVNAEVETDIVVDRSLEDDILGTLPGAVVAVAYDFHCEGTVRGIVDTKSIKTPLRLLIREERNVGVSVLIPREGEAPARQATSFRREFIEGYELPDTYPSFKNVKDLRAYLDARPKTTAAVLRMPDGGFVVRQLSERELRRLADLARRSRYNRAQLEQVPRYGGKTSRGVLDTLMLDGQEFHSLDDLADRYFDDEFMAGVGAAGSLPECEVYRMGTGSFGRKPLSHEQALKRAEELDKLSLKQVEALETEPGHGFESLWVRGVSGRVLQMDSAYFQARDEFAGRLPSVDAAKDQRARDDAISNFGRPFRAYLMVEADRERDNVTLISTLRSHEALASSFQLYLYTEVSDYAQQAAIEALAPAVEQIQSLADDPVQLRRFLAKFPGLSFDKQQEALKLLGIPEDKLNAYSSALGRADTSVELMLGNPVQIGGESITQGSIVAFAAKTAKGIDELVGQLQQGKITALHVKGPFGDYVRTLAYRRFGFRTLDPARFPHKDRVPESFPGPLSGDRASFSSLGEQLFVNHARTVGTVETIEKYLTAGAVVVGAAVVILFFNVIGAAIAALLFEVGSTAFFLASGAIAGFLMAGTQLGVEWALGGDITAGKAAETLLEGTAGGAFFGGLGRLLKGAGAALRFGVMAGAFFTYGAATFRLKTGKLPWESDSDTFAMWFYENVLTFALLEAGAVVARPATEQAGLWGRAKQLRIAPEKLAAFSADAARLNHDLAAFSVRPQRAPAEAAALKARMAALLSQQEALVNEVAAAARGRDNAATLEQELNTELAAIRKQLQNLEAAEWLTSLNIKPIGESQTAFTYKPTAGAKAKFEAFYRGATVTEERDGRIVVTLPGDKEPFVFVPEGAAAPAPVHVPGTPVATPKVNINTASAEELATLPGIGKKLGQAIVDYRKQNGDFTGVDQVRDVPGIGDKTFTKIAGLITAKAAEPGPNLVARADALAARQESIIDRADRAGIKDPTLDAIRLNKLKPRARGTDKGLNEAEALIAKAEAVAGARIDALAKQALEAAKRRPGVGAKGMAAARTDALADMTDTQVGEALLVLKGRRDIGPAQIRAALHAYRAKVDLSNFFGMAEGPGVAARNFALETYASLKDARVAGADRVIVDMGRSRLGWDGAMWSMEAARYGFGIENVAAFEVTIRGEGVRRDYDIVLKDGTKLELKNWEAWDDAGAANVNAPEDDQPKERKLVSQFLRDVKLGGYRPALFKTHRYVFRQPAPKPPAEIKRFLRGELETHLRGEVAAGRLTDGQLADLLTAFDNETDLVSASPARWTGTPPLSPPPVRPGQPPMAPSVPPDDRQRGKPAPVPAGAH
jgi:comEA protein